MNRMTALAITVFLCALWAGALQPQPVSFWPDQTIANLRAALDERNQRIDDYMQLEVMRCVDGQLTLNIDDSLAAEEAVYDYSDASGCKYMLLPEPGIGLMLAIGCLWLQRFQHTRDTRI